MSQDDKAQNIKTLDAIRSDYTGWFTALLTQGFYPEGGEGSITPPDTFVFWREEMQEKDGIDPGVLERLETIYGDLLEAAAKFSAPGLESGTKPPRELFTAFSAVFEEFLHHMERLQRSYNIAESGIDSVTGLRDGASLLQDLGKELERLSRQGKPFTVALILIDGEEAKKRDSALKKVAGLIQKNIRSFDDAYISAPGEFVLSLKQTDMIGAMSVLRRVRTGLEGEDYSVSSCIAEPIPGDNFEELLSYLRQDLAGGEPGSIIQHQEISPLQRYLQETH